MINRFLTIIGLGTENTPKSTSANRKFAGKRRIANHGKHVSSIKSKTHKPKAQTVVVEDKSECKTSVTTSTAATLKVIAVSLLPSLVSAVTCNEGNKDRMDFRIGDDFYAFVKKTNYGSYPPTLQNTCFNFMSAILSNGCNVTAMFANNLPVIANATIAQLCSGEKYDYNQYTIVSLGETLVNKTGELQCFLDMIGNNSQCHPVSHLSGTIIAFTCAGASIAGMASIFVCHAYANRCGKPSSSRYVEQDINPDTQVPGVFGSEEFQQEPSSFASQDIPPIDLDGLERGHTEYKEPAANGDFESSLPADDDISNTRTPYRQMA